jgi:hypothetical protein
MNWQAVNYSLCARAVLLHGLSFLTGCRSFLQLSFLAGSDHFHILVPRYEEVIRAPEYVAQILGFGDEEVYVPQKMTRKVAWRGHDLEML